MKKIYNLLTIIICSLFVVSCVHEDDKVQVNKEYGILPAYTEGSNTIYNLLDPDNSIVDFTIGASMSGGAEANTGELHARVNDGDFVKIADITAFPYSYSGSLNSVLSDIGLELTDVTGGDIINYRTYFNLTDGQVITSVMYQNATIVCPPVAGDYTIAMQDSYGDGWQGGKVVAILDGVTHEFFMCSQYDPCTATSYTSTTETFTVPAGSSALVWSYVDDTYNSEVSFQITDPDGQVIANLSEPSGGPISVPSTCPN